jgi:nitrite reductase/ring-hydroxylating ferredoxin subunit
MTIERKRVKAGVPLDFPPDSHKIVELDGIEIGIFNVDGELYALRNECPHAGAPICRGRIGGTLMPSAPGTIEFGLEGRVLRCPWHGLEVDVTTGRPLLKSLRQRVRRYEVEVYDGQVFVTI